MLKNEIENDIQKTVNMNVTVSIIRLDIGVTSGVNPMKNSRFW